MGIRAKVVEKAAEQIVNAAATELRKHVTRRMVEQSKQRVRAEAISVKNAVTDFYETIVIGKPAPNGHDQALWGDDAEAVRAAVVALHGHHPERGGQERAQAAYAVIQAVKPILLRDTVRFTNGFNEPGD